MYPDDNFLQEHVKKLIELDNEDPKTDLKQTLDISSKYRKAELIKDISGLVNSEPINDPNGYYIIGAHHRELFDVSSLKLDDFSLQQISNSMCDKPISFQYKQFSISSKTIGVLIIPKSHERPHLVLRDYYDENSKKLLQKGTCFIRKGSSTEIANRQDYDLMYEERVKKRVNEDIELRKHIDWNRAPRGLTERYADIEIRKEIALETYNSILEEIKTIFQILEVTTKEQFYYRLIQTIGALIRVKESEKSYP